MRENRRTRPGQGTLPAAAVYSRRCSMAGTDSFRKPAAARAGSGEKPLKETGYKPRAALSLSDFPSCIDPEHKNHTEKRFRPLQPQTADGTGH